MSKKIAWGIIGAGGIAKAFARALPVSKTGELIAIGSRTQATADAFGDEFNVPRRYGSYEALLADKDVEAVYISTPHPMHAEWAVKAADAGKHILCEKPLTLNYPEAMAVVEAARRNDVFLMEAFMYRCNPQAAKIVELIKDRVIGDVRIINATFSFHAGFNLEGRLLNPELGGGGILDVGCYCASMVRMVAGAAIGKDIAEPIEIKAMGHIGEVTGVDEYTTAILKFPNDIIAQVSTGVLVNQENAVRIYGTEGNIMVPSPWFSGRELGGPRVIVKRNDEREPREIIIDDKTDMYAIEADTVAAAIEKRQAPAPAMTWDDSLGNMRTLDTWRQGIGMIYDSERSDANYPTIDRQPLTARSGNTMKYSRIPGIENPVSRLVMGVMLGGAQFLLPHASVLFDEFFANGGNYFDTAHIYGPADSILGQWIKNRGIRDQVNILAKGAHTPWCNPDDLTTQLMESLERLQTDYVDIYMLHRDNPEIPVDEFIDVLNQHHRERRIRAFGASNWCIDRITAANEYAAKNGLVGFSAVSNNFSLARMVEAPWAGCLSSSDSASREWFAKTQMPLMAWSSTSAGFFFRGDKDVLTDSMLVNCWYSEDNFQRLERAKELAEKKGVSPVEIAMAYVLCQPFPIFALFGPQDLKQLNTSIHALNIELTSEEMKWLNLEA